MDKNKKSILDIISLVLIILNFFGIINTAVFADKLYRITNILDCIVVSLFIYTVFVIPITIVVGNVLNIISIIKKKKVGNKFWINIVYMFILILTIPIWYEFWFLALMSV